MRNDQGHARMCIRASFEDLDPSKSCVEQFGELVDEFYHLTTDDDRLAKVPEIRIRIEPVFKDENEHTLFQNQFDINTLNPRKIWFNYMLWVNETKGVHKLSNGLPYYGNVQTEEQDNLIFEFYVSPSTSYVVLNFEVENKIPDKLYPIEITAEANYLQQNFFNPLSG